MRLNDLTRGALLCSLVKFGYQLPATFPRSISCAAIIYVSQADLMSTDLGHVRVTQAIMFMWQRRAIYICLAFSLHHSIAPKTSDCTHLSCTRYLCILCQAFSQNSASGCKRLSEYAPTARVQHAIEWISRQCKHLWIERGTLGSRP